MGLKKESGIKIGLGTPGPRNLITDVPGVKVGHVTVRDGADINTGVTAILPHEGNMFQDKVMAASCVINGFGIPGIPGQNGIRALCLNGSGQGSRRRLL